MPKKESAPAKGDDSKPYRDLIYSTLCKRMVDEGYFRHSEKLDASGITPEVHEDGKLPKGFFIYCEDFERSPLYKVRQKNYSWLELEKRWVSQIDNMLKTLDGANIFDKERVSTSIVFNGDMPKSLNIFNKANGTSYEVFDDAVQPLLPYNFTYPKGGEILRGSKTMTALSLAILEKSHPKPIETYLSKTTVYGTKTGTGLVTRMRVNREGLYTFGMFFLAGEDELPDHIRDMISNDSYIDEKRKVVAVQKYFETSIYRPSLRLTKRGIIKPSEIFG